MCCSSRKSRRKEEEDTKRWETVVTDEDLNDTLWEHSATKKDCAVTGVTTGIDCCSC